MRARTARDTGRDDSLSNEAVHSFVCCELTLIREQLLLDTLYKLIIFNWLVPDGTAQLVLEAAVPTVLSHGRAISREVFNTVYLFNNFA